MTITDKLILIAENEKRVYDAGYRKGKTEGGGGSSSGEKPTLFTPYIVIDNLTSILTITDDNGGFAQGYNLYANDELVTVLTSKTVTLNDYIEQTETLNIKVQAVGANFNSSDYAVVEWKYVNVNGTAGLAYEISSDGTYAICKGIGVAIATDIEIASVYDGLNVKSISQEGFKNCKTLENITIPETITSIGLQAFMGCNKLTGVVIPNSVTYIGDAAFANCTDLKSVILSNSVITLTETLFYNCTSLTSVVIPTLVTNIKDSVFVSCTSLKRLDFSNHTEIPTIRNGIFGNTHADLQIKVPASLIDAWKTATNWANYADKIVTEFTNTL